MSDPRMRIWRRAHTHPLGIASEAPESGNLPPEGEHELFPHEKPLPAPEHPGQLPPHYRVAIEHPNTIETLPPRPPKVPHTPKGNILFDTLRSQQLTSSHIIEYMASGTVTPPVGSFLSFTVNNFTPQPLRLRLMEQPFTVHAYIMLRRFFAVPLTFADTGAMVWEFIDSGGIPAVLSTGAANAAVNQDLSLLMPTPFTDATPPNIGSLSVGAGSGASIAATWQWYLNFSFMYMRPGELNE